MGPGGYVGRLPAGALALLPRNHHTGQGRRDPGGAGLLSVVWPQGHAACVAKVIINESVIRLISNSIFPRHFHQIHCNTRLWACPFCSDRSFPDRWETKYLILNLTILSFVVDTVLPSIFSELIVLLITIFVVATGALACELSLSLLLFIHFLSLQLCGPPG